MWCRLVRKINQILIDEDVLVEKVVKMIKSSLIPL
jgi:hypothetical protein